MDVKRSGGSSSGQFRQVSYDNNTISTGPSDRSTQFGGMYSQSNSGYIQQGNYSTDGFRQPVTDPRQVYEKRMEGLTRLRKVGMFNIALAVVTMVVGLATLIVASDNIGFPVFNFGVLLVGILHFIPGVLCYLAGRNGMKSLTDDSLALPSDIKCYIIIQFVFSVTVITFAILAAVFAFISGAVCAGADIKFQTTRNGEVVKELDVKQYCEPNNDANAALAFIGGCLCIVIGVMSIYGTAWVCCYGLYFGWRRRNGVGISYP